MPSGRPCDPSRGSNQQAADCNRQQREEGGGQQTQKRKKKKGEESRRQYLWQVDGPNAMVEAAHACSLEAATATGGWWWWWWWCSGGGGESSMEHVGYMCNRYCLRASTSTYNFLVQRNVASGMHSPVRRPPRARL